MQERVLEVFGQVIDFVFKISLARPGNQSNVGKFPYLAWFQLLCVFVLFKKIAERLVIGSLRHFKGNDVFKSHFKCQQVGKQVFLISNEVVDIIQENSDISLIRSLKTLLVLHLPRSHPLLL